MFLGGAGWEYGMVDFGVAFGSVRRELRLAASGELIEGGGREMRVVD